ncbi:MAG: transcriptional repressor [Candidatus Woesearchaeota archaeon]|jgi:Fe2+ or Zn2+ uptake regulation protein
MAKQSRNTKQKELLNKTLNEINSFFSAEYFHNQVMKKDNSIGIATIYRYLSDLKTKKQIYSYICDRKTIYSKENKSHCHFICEKSNKTHHFEIDSLDFLKNKIPGSIISFQLEVRGICNECNVFSKKK